MTQPPPVDSEKDAADYDWVKKTIDESPERRLWIIYLMLHRQGYRIERADQEIRKLAPRKAPS
jgi:hypothetical protein